MRPNPFTIRTPEALSTDEIIALFENVFADIPTVNQPGHTFIHGARGSGKSMMFQYMLPKVQSELLKISMPGHEGINNLPYYSFYFPIKSQDFNALQGSSLNDSQKRIIFAHYLTMSLTEIILSSLKETFDKDSNKPFINRTKEFFKNLNALLSDYGISDHTVVVGDFDTAIDTIRREQRAVSLFLAKLALNDNEPYRQGISSFIDFVVPLLRNLRFLTSTQFYILIDDADELEIEMQRIINTWVSHRTTDIVSIKVSTQLRYQTYRTSSGSVIESPHDFTNVDLTQIYTSKVNHYFQRVERIVERRLKYYGFLSSPIEFFPGDPRQERQIKIEAEKILAEYANKGVSSRPNDDVYRYAIPNYMASLLETKKSNSFSYSGFRTLVNLSAGTIRYFLEPASKMYESIENTQGNTSEVDFIKPKLQNQIVREWSTNRYTEALPDLVTSSGENSEDVSKLKNLIHALGDLFANKLLDRDASERRVFSIFTDDLPDDLEKIVSLGVSYGYLQKSTIRSKERTGRKSEIIFSRTLAPHFYLDPTGYSGRLSVTIEDLRQACTDPGKFVRNRLKIDRRQPKNVDSLFGID